jgi:hypothetical protein
MLTSESNVIIMFKAVDSIKLSSNVEFLSGLVKVFDSWVIAISSKNFLSFLGPIID